jgi:pyruvate kinase
MAKEILCTLGPASLDPRIIGRLEQGGATLFRINLSHTKVRDLPRLIETIRSATEIPICLDTEGAQIRTGDLVNGDITMRDNTIVRAHARRVPGDDKNFSLYPAGITEQLEVGDFISIDFNSVLVQVIGIEKDFVSMRVLHGGRVGQNKAVTVERDIPIPPLSEKDEAALELGRELGLRHFALSFANAGSDVQEIRRHVGEDAFVISKIESLSGLANLEEIASHSNALLIDRGDLSRQVPVELLPQTQKCVIHRAKRVGCSVYVATNLLESMVSAPTPTRAEVNDIYNTLADGADGLVLAAETAIGQFPIQCVSMVSKMIRGAEKGEGDEKDFYPVDAVSLLPRLCVSERDLMDCEQLANGTYSPLAGFMDRQTLDSVLNVNRLPAGEIWTLPILLQIDAGRDLAFSTGDRVALTYDDGEIHALLDVSEIYDYDLEKLALGIYGTSSTDHPGVARVMAGGGRFIAGEVTLVQPLASPHRHYLLTPAQSRFVFTQLGWSQVVGFHGRNPAHRGHEFIQAQALESTGADGLYINPVIGPKKKGDFLPGPILQSYQTLLEFGCYPKGKAVLGSFFTYSRYAGPREAVFTALCRKNMGCSHFIVGRDHSGVGRFYEADANRKLFDSLGDLGVEPIFFETVGYNASSGALEVDRGQPLEMISGTEVRETLRAEKRLPDWFMRELVQEVLIAEIRNGNPVFYDS